MASSDVVITTEGDGEALVVATFRKRVQPFVTEVARKRRLDIVMYSGPNLFYVRDQVDLTDEVVAKSKAYFAKDLLGDHAFRQDVVDPELWVLGFDRLRHPVELPLADHSIRPVDLIPGECR